MRNNIFSPTCNFTLITEFITRISSSLDSVSSIFCKQVNQYMNFKHVNQHVQFKNTLIIHHQVPLIQRMFFEPFFQELSHLVSCLYAQKFLSEMLSSNPRAIHKLLFSLMYDLAFDALICICHICVCV